MPLSFYGISQSCFLSVVLICTLWSATSASSASAPATRSSLADTLSDKEGTYANEFVLEISDDVTTVADLLRELNTSWSGHARLLSELYIEGLGRILHVRHTALSRRSTRSIHDSVGAAVHIKQVKQVVQQSVLTREKRGWSYDGDYVVPNVHPVPPSKAKLRGSAYHSADKINGFSKVPRAGYSSRPIVYDKQLELPELRYYDNKDVFLRFQPDGSSAISASDQSPPSNEAYPFNDPFLRDQWYLINRGQAGGPRGHDLNVLPVWKKGITGRGVVVSILDDGVQHAHEDLRHNYDARASADLNDDSDDDPSPDENNLSENSHGTRCAGEVAAEANNGICGVGVAFNARIGGVRMLDGVVTDVTEARALLYNNQYISVYSASWGPKDDGETMEGPGVYCKAALREGVTRGRNGLGSIFVWATGNGGYKGDDCNADGYVSSPYTLSVGSINNYGQSTYFMESCPSTMAVVFTGGAHEREASSAAGEEGRPVLKVVTTDVGNRCTLNFQGTSSAAPLAAGCVALTLEANPRLTWRDVQHVVVRTAKIPNPDEPGWTINGAGYHVNDLFGFGVMDCGKMVELAQKWTTVGVQHVCHVNGPLLTPPSLILRGQTTRLHFTTDACQKLAASRIDELEHVEMSVRIAHPARGRLKLLLTSPAGTTSEMLSFRPNDHSIAGIDFTFMTVHSWGEDPRGMWVLNIVDSSSSASSNANEPVGSVSLWSLTFYGTSRLSSAITTKDKDTKAFEPGNKKLQTIMDAEQQSSETVHIRAGKEQVDKSGEQVLPALIKASQGWSQDDRDRSQGTLDSEIQQKLRDFLDHADADFVDRLVEELRQGLTKQVHLEQETAVTGSSPDADTSVAEISHWAGHELGAIMKRGNTAVTHN